MCASCNWPGCGGSCGYDERDYDPDEINDELDPDPEPDDYDEVDDYDIERAEIAYEARLDSRW